MYKLTPFYSKACDTQGLFSYQINKSQVCGKLKLHYFLLYQSHQRINELPKPDTASAHDLFGVVAHKVIQKTVSHSCDFSPVIVKTKNSA